MDELLELPMKVIHVNKEIVTHFLLYYWHGSVIKNLSIDIGTDKYMRDIVSFTTNPHFLFMNLPESNFPQEMNEMNGFPDIYTPPEPDPEPETEYCECCGQELYEENW